MQPTGSRQTSDDDTPPDRSGRQADRKEVGNDTDVLEGTSDYAIGYGRPPEGNRFKPGHSGNPKGRPPGSQAFKTLLQRELEERVSVKDQGRRRRLSKRGVIVKRLVSEAMAGNPKHLAIVLAQDPIAAEVLDEVTAALTRPADAAVKADLIRRLRAAAVGEPEPEPVEQPGSEDEEASS